MASRTPDYQGTHMQRARPAGGWPNCKDPEQHPGRKIRQARKRLEKRVKSYEDTVKESRSNSSAYRKPGSLKVQ